MLIDWFTIGAQALNFLLLVWLLKHFLYRPILAAIEAREQAVAKELTGARDKLAEADRKQTDFQQKNDAFDAARAGLLQKATEEVAVARERLLDEARAAAEALGARRHEALLNDAASLHQTLLSRCREEVFAITRKTLTELATTSLEERMGEVFTRRLRELDSEARQTLGAALTTAAEPARVVSTFELPPEQRAAIQNACNETFSAAIRLRFETSPDLVSGVELSCNGLKLAWSISDYLLAMEKSVEELLLKGVQPKPRAKAAHKPARKQP